MSSPSSLGRVASPSGSTANRARLQTQSSYDEVIEASNDVAPVDRVDPTPMRSYMRPLPLKTQLWRFLIAFFLATFFLAGGIVITNARMPDPKKVRPLPDIMLELLPKWHALEAGTNICIFLINAAVVVVWSRVYLLERRERGLPNLKLPWTIPVLSPFVDKVVFGIWDSNLRPFRLRGCTYVMGIRFCTVYMCMMFYRTFCITMTSYPPTDNHCQNPKPITNPLKNMILTVVTFGSGAIHCGDLMFSGHTIILSLGACLLFQYGRFVHPWLFRVWGPVFVFLGFICILVSQSHYTDDILVALHGTVATFIILHHRDDGACWQLQLLIRWWPCPCSNDLVQEREEAEEASRLGGGASTEVVVINSDENPRTPPVRDDGVSSKTH